MKEGFDSRTSYCRSLGHYVPFRYCRTVNNGLPCRKIRDCWFEKIDIDGFIAEFYTESEQKQIFALPEEKISSLIDLIRKAQENK